jgi:hypothetical protein
LIERFLGQAEEVSIRALMRASHDAAPAGIREREAPDAGTILRAGG